MISQFQRSSIACYLGNYTAIGFSVSDNEINEKSREVNYYWNYPIFPLIDDDFLDA